MSAAWTDRFENFDLAPIFLILKLYPARYGQDVPPCQKLNFFCNSFKRPNKQTDRQTIQTAGGNYCLVIMSTNGMVWE